MVGNIEVPFLKTGNIWALWRQVTFFVSLYCKLEAMTQVQ